jgi:hypothetical protein
MITLCSPGETRLCDRRNRREILQVGALGALGISLADVERAHAAGAAPIAPSARSVIMIFNCGAPSHHDLWDMKPDAPAEIRGIFKPISTNVAGIQVSELMPKLAQRADRYAIVRSVYHKQFSHNSGMFNSIVGQPYPRDSTLINPSRNDHPSFGTLVGWLARRDGYKKQVPPYVITPAPHCDSTVYLTPGQYGGMLGAEHDPFVLNTDPNSANFKVPNLELALGVNVDRLQHRRALLERMDTGLRALEERPLQDLDTAQSRAFSLVTSDAVRKAFDLGQEPQKVRDRYGRHTWGQSHLLARRLVEAGSRFVTTVNGQSIIWDTHLDNFNRLKNRLVPPMETAFVALLDDLSERGLLDSTLVVWIGDFGRTPKINADAGRDHWPHCYSVVLAGGGIRGGQVVGESDATGGYPVTRAVTPADIHATVFHALGYDVERTFFPALDGRPMPLSTGQPILELLG